MRPAIVAIDDHVAEIDSDAEDDALVLRHLGIAVDHRPLHLHRAPHGVNHAGIFCQEAVADVLHNPTAVFGDFWIDQLAEVGFQAFMRALLISPH
jgi:hypothetical protein